MDIIKSELVSLEDLAFNYAYVLIDNCSFQFRSRDNKSHSIEKKISHYKKDIEYWRFWNQNMKSFPNLYVTPKVLEEMDGKGTSYKYGKSIKKRSRNHSDVLRLRRTIKDSHKQRNLLSACIRDLQRIFEFDQEEDISHNSLYKKYFYFKEYFDIEETDFDLLISGLVLFQTRGSSAIISNDSNLGFAYASLIKKENISEDYMGFFTRKHLSIFQRWRDLIPSSYK